MTIQNDKRLFSNLTAYIWGPPRLRSFIRIFSGMIFCLKQLSEKAKIKIITLSSQPKRGVGNWVGCTSGLCKFWPKNTTFIMPIPGDWVMIEELLPLWLIKWRISKNRNFALFERSTKKCQRFFLLSYELWVILEQAIQI